MLDVGGGPNRERARLKRACGDMCDGELTRNVVRQIPAEVPNILFSGGGGFQTKMTDHFTVLEITSRDQGQSCPVLQ